jgi:hypothetical protein
MQERRHVQAVQRRLCVGQGQVQQVIGQQVLGVHPASQSACSRCTGADACCWSVQLSEADTLPQQGQRSLCMYQLSSVM